jgi:hypothetical protein
MNVMMANGFTSLGVVPMADRIHHEETRHNDTGEATVGIEFCYPQISQIGTDFLPPAVLLQTIVFGAIKCWA